MRGRLEASDTLGIFKEETARSIVLKFVTLIYQLSKNIYEFSHIDIIDNFLEINNFTNALKDNSATG